MPKNYLKYLALLLVSATALNALEESFVTLNDWERLIFSDIPESNYEAVEAADAEGGSKLKATSAASGSALVWKESWDVRETPVLHWRWRVDDPIEEVDPTRKSGDDYALRVYVYFEYISEGLSVGERIQARAYRTLRGSFPPHSALTYVWSASDQPEGWYANPYTNRVKMMRINADTTLGLWGEEQINLLEDYRAAFGVDPPSSPARIVIMADSDDSGQSTHAYLDFIRLRE